MKKLLLIIKMLSLSLWVFGQAGSNDLTFNSALVHFGDGPNGRVETVVLQPDGKNILGGSFTSYNGTPRNYIVRINTDGSLDTTFDPGTGPNARVETLALQPDGKIIIGGQFTSYNGTTRNRIARLNADGSLDISFNPGTGSNNYVYATTLQPDGKIIIGGIFGAFNGTVRNRIARLNTDGSLDVSFDPGSGADLSVSTIRIQLDGKIVIGGGFTSYNGITRKHIARLNTNGSIDTTFDPGIGPNFDVWTFALQLDGKIIIGGSFTSYNGTAINRIARLNIDGTLDNSFKPGTGVTGSINSVSLQPDGKIIIGGNFTSYNRTSRNNIARLNADGSLDDTFNIGTGANNIVFTTTLQSDGRIIIGGNFTFFNGIGSKRVARLNSDGSMDTAFAPNSGANDRIWTTVLQSDGKIIIGGQFTSYNGTAINRIARLNIDGTLDKSFIPGTGANSSIRSISLQLDGKIIIVGQFLTNYNGTSVNNIARLNTDGSLDTSFNPGTGPNGSIFIITKQSDGKMTIGGTFSSFNGTLRSRLARLNVDGTLDTFFDPGSGADNNVWTITHQSDGKIIVGGDFKFYNGTLRSRLARLNVDGTLDTFFDPGSGADNSVYTSTVQIDGKIIIGGNFTSYNGISRNGVARLNQDGSLDDTFNPGSGVNDQFGTVWTTTLQPDGKIIIGGNFTSYNGTSRNNIARLNIDGSLDTSFIQGSGANAVIYTSTLQADGKILIGGEFTGYNEVSRVRIARILNSIEPNDPCEINSAPEITTITGPEAPLSLGSDALMQVDFSDENISSITWKVFDGNTDIQEFTDQVTGNKASRTFQNLPTGVFSILVELEDECGEKAIGQYDYVVIYDSDAGFVTGGGWIHSPEGAFAEDLTLIGRANFGFVAKYKKGKSKTHEVDGNTEFQFRSANLNFKSSSHDDMSLVIANHKAIYKGKGSINGQVGYAFMVSVIDGDKLSNGASDKFRIKIWAESSGQVIYDNQITTADNADPITAIEGGSIMIHEPGKDSQNNRMESEILGSVQINESLFDQLVNGLFDSRNLIIYPNPASDMANIQVNLSESSKVVISIFDTAGRLIYSEESQQENSFTRSIPLERVSTGIYHVVVKINHQYIQGRLIKQ